MSQNLIDVIVASVVITLSLTLGQVMLTLAALRARGWMIQQREDLEDIRQLITRDWE